MGISQPSRQRRASKPAKVQRDRLEKPVSVYSRAIGKAQRKLHGTPEVISLLSEDEEVVSPSPNHESHRASNNTSLTSLKPSHSVYDTSKTSPRNNRTIRSGKRASVPTTPRNPNASPQQIQREGSVEFIGHKKADNKNVRNKFGFWIKPEEHEDSGSDRSASNNREHDRSSGHLSNSPSAKRSGPHERPHPHKIGHSDGKVGTTDTRLMQPMSGKERRLEDQCVPANQDDKEEQKVKFKRELNALQWDDDDIDDEPDHRFAYAHRYTSPVKPNKEKRAPKRKATTTTSSRSNPVNTNQKRAVTQPKATAVEDDFVVRDDFSYWSSSYRTSDASDVGSTYSTATNIAMNDGSDDRNDLDIDLNDPFRVAKRQDLNQTTSSGRVCKGAKIGRSRNRIEEDFA